MRFKVFFLSLLLIFCFSAIGQAFYNQDNPAKLGFLLKPEFKFETRITGDGFKTYGLTYSEPDYGKGAGSLNINLEELGQSKNKVHLNYSLGYYLHNVLNTGLTIHYHRYLSSGREQLTTDLGFQLGEGIISLNALVENILCFSPKNSNLSAPRNIKVGLKLDLFKHARFLINMNDVFDDNQLQQLALGMELDLNPNLMLMLGCEEGNSTNLVSWLFGLDYQHQMLNAKYIWQDRQHAIGVGFEF